ncbi:regulatory protein RecX [Pseudomarimonas salicorniae]|uniref:Regulatory protein RecX n=1 Tax=Pseudomarimonas salicorniae TaxID=2933270 RepID=A0ABT0GFI0_9GAMM|nr:regulatory protein RecX [Lysobacter sp. CAU 1642]MCK7593296.1 recombination regulator RecX [Lysobacter sp. CAU 1642]
MPRAPRTPLQRAVGLLSRREHSRHELRRKLVQRGEEAEAVDQALDRLEQSGLQDERRFAESLLRQRVASGYGPRYIAAELATHQLPDALISQVLEAVEVDWQDQAADLVSRRFPQGLQDPSDRRRAAALLQRRGFDGETSRRAISAVQ